MSIGNSVLVALFTNGVVFVVLALLWVLILLSNKAINAVTNRITGGPNRPQQ